MRSRVVRRELLELRRDRRRDDANARAGGEQTGDLARRDSPATDDDRRQRRSVEHEWVRAHRNFPAVGSTTRNATYSTSTATNAALEYFAARCACQPARDRVRTRCSSTASHAPDAPHDLRQVQLVVRERVRRREHDAERQPNPAGNRGEMIHAIERRERRKESEERREAARLELAALEQVHGSGGGGGRERRDADEAQRDVREQPHAARALLRAPGARPITFAQIVGIAASGAATSVRLTSRARNSTTSSVAASMSPANESDGPRPVSGTAPADSPKANSATIWAVTPPASAARTPRTGACTGRAKGTAANAAAPR